MGILYLVATPIGNLEDITLRALRILKSVSLIATEDTRTTRRLLEHYQIQQPLISYFEHNKITRLDRLFEALESGDIAVVSEAGTPVISDPGYELVCQALARGFQVVPVPGASALGTALPAAGLPVDRFIFMGFLPRRSSARQAALQEVAELRATLVFYEAPHRLLETLQDAVNILGGQRRCAVCREMTKLFEEIWRGSLEEALEKFRRQEPRGEFTVLIEGALPHQWSEEEIRLALQKLLDRGEKLSLAAKAVAALSGWKKGDIYKLAE